jgi:hypothetical protein
MKPVVVVLVCADAEWKVIKEIEPHTATKRSPFGEWFERGIVANDTEMPSVFFQTGCGKIPAAAAIQYVLDLWKPKFMSTWAHAAALMELCKDMMSSSLNGQLYMTSVSDQADRRSRSQSM